jgi:hypothetical protein
MTISVKKALKYGLLEPYYNINLAEINDVILALKGSASVKIVMYENKIEYLNIQNKL